MTQHSARRLLISTVIWFVSGAFSFAAEGTPPPQPERPYLTLFAASLERLDAACEMIFETVERPDLAKSIDERSKMYRDFAGIDRGKPLGIMYTWDSESIQDIVFAPISEIQELLKTATFGVVGYHEVTADHYEIEKPGPPYHVVINKGYALFSHSLPTVRGLRVSPDQLTRRLKDRYDIVLSADLKQIPEPIKTRYVADLKQQIEPWLQPQDDEAVESASLRKTLGKLVLNLVERVVIDTKTLTVGAKLDPVTKQLSVEVIIDAVAKSQMASALNRMSAHRSEFAPLIHPDIPAGIAFNLPIAGLVEQILGTSNDRPTKDSQLEAGLQLAGSGAGDFSLIMALHGSDAAELNDAIPKLLTKLDQSGQFANINENFDVHRGVVLHSLTPRELPTAITDWIGAEVEIIIGQDKQTIWMGMGHPKPLLDRLLDAIDVVEEPSTTSRKTGSLVRARFEAQKLPELIGSDLLIPVDGTDVARKAFSDGKDGFTFAVEPIPDGMKLKLDLEVGFTKLVGQNWIHQIERTQSN